MDSRRRKQIQRHVLKVLGQKEFNRLVESVRATQASGRLFYWQEKLFKKAFANTNLEIGHKEFVAAFSRARLQGDASGKQLTVECPNCRSPELILTWQQRGKIECLKCGQMFRPLPSLMSCALRSAAVGAIPFAMTGACLAYMTRNAYDHSILIGTIIVTFFSLSIIPIRLALADSLHSLPTIKKKLKMEKLPDQVVLNIHLQKNVYPTLASAISVTIVVLLVILGLIYEAIAVHNPSISFVTIFAILGGFTGAVIGIARSMRDLEPIR